jgi:acyl carrier protein
MNDASLKDLIDSALGGQTATGRPSERAWDSLDQLEILQHLNDELGDGVNEVEALNKFEDLTELSAVLRAEGYLD